MSGIPPQFGQALLDEKSAPQAGLSPAPVPSSAPADGSTSSSTGTYMAAGGYSNRRQGSTPKGPALPATAGATVKRRAQKPIWNVPFGLLTNKLTFKRKGAAGLLML